MANINKMLEAFEHFINNDTDKAKESYRQFFIESAKEINRKLDEATEDEFEEEFEDDSMESTDEFEDESTDEVEDELVTGDEEGEWTDVQDKFAELESLFAEFADELDQYGEVDDHEDLDGVDDEFEDEFGGEEELEVEDEDMVMENSQLIKKGTSDGSKRGKKVNDGASTSDVYSDKSAKSVTKDSGQTSIKSGNPVMTKEADVTGTNSGTKPDGDLKGSPLPGSNNVDVDDHNNVIDKTEQQFDKVNDGASKKDTYSDPSAKSMAKQNNK